MNLADVVYICRPGDENEELRFSLRSLSNLPHGRVWIAGHMPPWVREATAIPVNGRRDKQGNAQDNLVAACNHPEVSDPFYVFNDDFFIMAPMQSIPVQHRGPVEQVIKEHLFGSAYRTAMERTYQLMLDEGITDPLSYEMHAPLLIEKLTMLLALSIGRGINGFHNRTFYGNLVELGGEKSEDVKVYRSSRGRDWQNMPLLSTSDQVFRTHPVGRFIRQMFPEQGPYEKNTARMPRHHGAVRYTTVVNRL